MSTHRNSPRDTAILRWCVLGLCVLFGYYLIYIVRRIDHDHHGDFPTFYDAARAVLRHSDPYIPEPGGMAYVYPPMFALLCTPLAKLPMPHAEKIFLTINVAAALGSLLIGSREMLRRFGASVAAPGVCAVALLAGILVENDLRGELQAMETDVLMLLMFTLALHWLDHRPFRSGAALAFALNIKYLSIIALPYLILRRRWKAAGGLIGWTVAFGLMPALVLGWKENLRCLHVAVGGLLGWMEPHAAGAPPAHVHAIADGLSVSITSAIARQLKMHQLPQSHALLIAAGIGLALLLVAWGIYRVNRLPFWQWPKADAQQRPPYLGLVALEWCALIVVALAFSPNTNTRHLSMVALIYTGAAALLLVPRPGVPRWPLLIGTVILFVGLILPLPGMFHYSAASRSFATLYFRWSICSWALLAMYAGLLITGLPYVRTLVGSASADGIVET